MLKDRVRGASPHCGPCGQPVDDHRHRVAGVIDKQLVAAAMGLPHRDRDARGALYGAEARIIRHNGTEAVRRFRALPRGRSLVCWLCALDESKVSRSATFSLVSGPCGHASLSKWITN